MAAGKKVKDKKIIQVGRITTPRRRFVTQDNPLANLTKSHPEYENTVVIESTIDENQENLFNIENNSLDALDIDTTDYFSGTDNASLESLTLDTPQNISVDIFNIKKYVSPDGTLRISLEVNFDEVLRADDYEVRISSV